jgi:hypothetical protein
MLPFRKALVRQSAQRSTTFRPRFESLENRVTPSVDVTSTLLTGAVADVPVATTSGQTQMEAPPEGIPIVHGQSNLGWGSLYTGVTIKGKALDAPGARLIQVCYAHGPVSGDIGQPLSYPLLGRLRRRQARRPLRLRLQRGRASGTSQPIISAIPPRHRPRNG